MIGTCEYCGQQLMLSDDDKKVREAIEQGKTADDIASEQCKCEAGQKFRSVQKAAGIIDSFVDDAGTRDLLLKAFTLVNEEIIMSMSIKIPNTVKITMKKTSKGKVRIDRINTHNKGAEL